jgi:hypothetical protein
MLLRGVPAVEILVTRLIALASLNRPKCSYSNGKGLAAFPLWETLLIPFSSAGSFFDSRIGHEKSTRQLPALFPSSLPRVYLW